MTKLIIVGMLVILTGCAGVEWLWRGDAITTGDPQDMKENGVR